MPECRIKIIEQAFQKLDTDDDGIITTADLKALYNVKYHPRYISGEESEESILNKFLGNFENNDTTDGKVIINYLVVPFSLRIPNISRLSRSFILLLNQ